jgi:CheY-like chemotaxis protein
MASNGTLLCIHRDPAQLSLLQKSGYDLVTATNGSEGLRLFTSRPVDGIVLEYYLGLINGAIVADEIKQLRPKVPIVMLTENLELPFDALKSVDAVVVKSDGAHFLLATVHFLLHVKPARPQNVKSETGVPGNPRLSVSREAEKVSQARPPASAEPTSNKLASAHKDMPFSAEDWQSIRNGTVRF